jgi:release factor glutamine methyltransferase
LTAREASVGAAQEGAAGAGPAEGAATWDELYRVATDRLGDRREARWMIEEASGEPFGRIGGAPSEKARRRLHDMVERRMRGEPLQYVIGSWPFRRVDLMVDPRVLIPRPETEQVVEIALAELDRVAGDPTGMKTAVDLGTGSGAIALSLAKERTKVQVWAVDDSPGAVAVARANLAGLAGFAATRVRIAQGDWWDALPADLRGRVDLAVSNPPYISREEMVGLDPQVRDWEPRRALEAGPAGTEAIERILDGAPGWLTAEGAMVIELAPHQAEGARDLARRVGFAEAEVRPDLAGRPRALVARRPGPRAARW